MRGAGPGLGVRITASSFGTGRSIGLGLGAARRGIAPRPSWRGRSSTPSPASRHQQQQRLDARADRRPPAWPRRRASSRPESQSFLPSPTTRNSTEAGPPAASSTPTLAVNRSVAAARSIQSVLLACVPTPCSKVLPADRQRLLADRAVDLRLAPALLHFGEVEFFQPNRLGSPSRKHKAQKIANPSEPHHAGG